MAWLIIDTCYPGFLAWFQAEEPGLSGLDYAGHHRRLMGRFFGTFDAYSHHLAPQGVEAHEVVANYPALQSAWARSHARGLWLDGLWRRGPLLRPWLDKVLAAQLRLRRPEVVFVQDIHWTSPAVLRLARELGALVVGQVASPLGPDLDLGPYDLMLSSFPHFVRRFRAQGQAAAYLRLGFDSRVWEALGGAERDLPLTFVGGLSRHHGKGNRLLAELAARQELQVWGYGAGSLEPGSPLARCHRGEAWGDRMFAILGRSRLTLNRHIDAAEGCANNMRLFEATGMGACLVTDRGSNLAEMFEPGREVAVYDGLDDCLETVSWLLDHPDAAGDMARAGQARTLGEHGYDRRMAELVELVEDFRRSPGRFLP